MAGSLYTDEISESGIVRRRTLEAQLQKGSGSVPMIATREVCVLSPWMNIVAMAGCSAYKPSRRSGEIYSPWAN